MPEPDRTVSPADPGAASRASAYGLLGTLLAGSPDAALLARLRAIPAREEDGGDGLAAAWAELRRAAERAEPGALEDEYFELFIGVGRGELVPYGSWYLTGFLMEKPLGDLRRDLERLGFQRSPEVREPEDHVAALCEVMGQLALDTALPAAVQRQFFERHIAPWFPRFFEDLGEARAARFYRAVARLGGTFTAFEARYLSMPV